MLHGRSTTGRGLITSLAIAIALLIIPQSAYAASALEIVEMSDAGIPPGIIIEVIEATGFDDTLDTDTFVYLYDYGVDQEIIDYLLGYTDDDTRIEVSGYERWGTEDHPNYAGGPGFDQNNDYPRNYSGSGYWTGYDDYRDSDRNSNWYNDGVTVYRPPVYTYNRNYGNYYYSDPYYYSNRGSWYNGSYRVYNHNYNNRNRGNSRYYNHRNRNYDNYWRDREWDSYHPSYNDPWHAHWYDGDYGLRGRYRYDRYYDRWHSDWDAHYRNDGWSIRLSF